MKPNVEAAAIIDDVLVQIYREEIKGIGLQGHELLTAKEILVNAKFHILIGDKKRSVFHPIQHHLIDIGKDTKMLTEIEVAGDEERHYAGCICAECSGAELTADND